MCVQWSLHVLSCPKGGLVITRYNEGGGQQKP